MKACLHWGGLLAVIASLGIFAGCNPTTGHTVGGRVAGLVGEVVLTLNGSETKAVSRNGLYRFETRFNTGSSYNIAVSSQPSGQSCSVQNGSGVVQSANISNVNISCVTSVPAPLITHVWPASVLAGEEVKISGNNLDLATVTYDGAVMPTTLRNAHELRFIAPENPRGSYLLEVENIAGFSSQTVAQGEVLTSAVAISAGFAHTCALMEGGSVQCWGDNENGQLGTGNNIGYRHPVNVVGITNAVAVSASGRGTCALLDEGSVQCWGNTENIPTTIADVSNAIAISGSCAVLGNGSVSCWDQNGSVNAIAGISSAISIAADGNHGCAVLSSGAVQCWGDNSYGQLGDGSTLSSHHSAVTVQGIANAMSVDVGGFRYGHSCALLADGTVSCWGSNYYGSLGDGTFVDSYTPVSVVGIINATSLSSGGDVGHNCITTEVTSVQCWGQNRNDHRQFTNTGGGQLGDGAIVNRPTPVVVPDVENAIAVAAGDGPGHSCALLASGSVRCWGINHDGWGYVHTGQLGNGATIGSTAPVTISGLTNAVSLTGNYRHRCAQTESGTVACWGTQHDGTLDDYIRSRDTAPVSVNGLNGVAEISAGAFHNCARLLSGSLRCWGSNYNGQLGGFADGGAFVNVVGISTATSVSAGYRHSCAALADGSVQCWGFNPNGELGHGMVDYVSLPPGAVIGINTATAASAGVGHSCALLSSGAVQCWGANQAGQLGDGSYSNSETPVLVVGISNAIAISAGSGTTCALLSSGEVRCWGHNFYGQLGDGTTESSAVPVAVSGISTATAVVTGNGSSCALLSTGRMQCWGSNASGALGNGTTIHSSVPTNVFGITNAVAISQTCAALADGVVQCWGANESDQLSLPSGLRQLTPGLPVFNP